MPPNTWIHLDRSTYITKYFLEAFIVPVILGYAILALDNHLARVVTAEESDEGFGRILKHMVEEN